jgi:hypothetical protein
MNAGRSSIHLVALAAAALLLGAAPAAAQTIANPQKKAAAKQPAKPAPRAPAAKLSDQPADNYWTAKTDLGNYSRETPTERQPFERRQLPNQPGTVGFYSGTVRSGTLQDGSAVPGLERYNQTGDSFAGMSLQLTPANKGFPLVGGLGGNGW